MRTNTIKNFAKRLVMVLAVGFMVVNAWGAKYSITPNQASTGSSATTYIETLTGFTYANPTGSKIKWKMNYWNPKTLQIKSNQSNAANEFRFYTDSVLPGKITKVVVTFSALTVSDATKLMFKGGTSAQTGTSSGTAGTWNSSAKTLTWTPGSSDNYTYFAFYQNGKAASGTIYLASSDAIVVTYLTKVTLDKNSGTADGVAYFDDNATAASTATGYTFSAPTHATKTCTGYYTDSSGGTKVLNADGTFAAATVSGYITSSKWTYAGGTLKLYAQWEASCTSQTVTVSDGDTGSDAYEGEYDYGTSPISLSLSKTGSGAVTWTSDATDVATVSGNSNGATVTIVGAGIATITASVAADATYCAGSGEYTLLVNAVAPTLSHNTSGKELGTSNITSTSARAAGGIVTNKGGADITKYGIILGTSSDVEWGTATQKKGSSSDVDLNAKFTFADFTGLTPNTTYYVRAFAYNGTEYGYSTAVSFTTLQSYAISYNNNGGSGSMDGSTKDHGVAFALPANAGSMTKTGHHITGWLLNSGSGTHYDLGGSYTTNANATFFAEWTANTYQVAFNANGGSGSMSNETGFTYGESKALTTCSFTAPEHKYFIGWNTNSSASTALYTDGQSVSNLTDTDNGTVTLYAIWKDHTYTNYRTLCSETYDIVLHDNNGGIHNGSAKVANNGTTLTNIEAPTKNGYSVEGYYTNSGMATKIATDEGALQSDVSTWTDEDGKWVLRDGATFYAKWEPTNYTITYEELEGASNTNPTSYTIETATIVLANPGSREGYTFDGWTCGGDPITQIVLGTTGNKTITATWSINTPNLAVSAADHVVITATPASESAIAEGANRNVDYNKTVTLNCAPEDHWSIEWDVYKTGESSTKVALSGSGDGATFTMPDYAVTVSAVMTEAAYKTVCFKNNGEDIDGYASVKVYVGESPVAPTLTDGTSGDACDPTSDKHYGWAKETWTSTIATQSEIDARTGTEAVYGKSAALPVVAAGDPATIIYHAVWAESVGVPSNEYQLVTNISQLSAGDKIVIANAKTTSTYLLGYQRHTDAGYHFRPQSSNAYTITSSKVTLTSSDIAAISSDETHPYVLTLGKNGDYWTFYDAVNGGYLCATTADKNELNVRAEDSDGASRFTISISSDAASITSQVTPESTPHNLLQYLTNTFSCYKSTSGGTNPYIFRNLATVGYQKFLTTCCSHRIDAPDVEDSKTAYTVTLSWDAVETANGDATSYEMQWNGGDWTTVTSPVEKSELTPNTAYSWKVRVKTWTGEYYCAAEEANGSTTTNPVYTVTYDANGGTEEMIDANSPYEAGDEVTVLTNAFIKAGYNFSGWSYSPAVSVTEDKFEMPSSNVTITAQWTALHDKYYDRMHETGGLTDASGYKYTDKSGAGYSVPSCTDKDGETGNIQCEKDHYKFLGWLESTYINDDGSLKDGATSHLIPASGTTDATGKTYYAIWGEE